MSFVDELAVQLDAAQGVWIGTALLVVAVSGVFVVVALRERRERRRTERADLNLWDAEVLTDAGQRAIHQPDRVERLIADALAEEADHQMLRDGVCPDDLHDVFPKEDG